MGKRGPRPTPTPLLKLTGSKLAGRRGAEVRPDASMPKCPSWLDGEAKKKWKELAPELHRLGILTSVDGGVMAAYCQAWAEFKLSTETLQKEGRTFTTATGYMAPHPAVAQQRSAWGAMKAMGELLGLSPAGRVSLPGQPERPAQGVMSRDRHKPAPPADDLEEFLAEHRQGDGGEEE
jgi:P27 family predicted phage terminase small subunit